MKKLLLITSMLIYGIINAQIVTIPDANFKQALLDDVNINTNGDTEIQVSEALVTHSLSDLNNKNIADLTGIEAFVNLTSLECWGNQLTTLDLSNNTMLINLKCFDNQIATLNLSNNTDLVSLKCELNQLTTLDFSGNPNLDYLTCGDNQLTTLNLSNNTNLTLLACSYNQLTTLDISAANLNNFSCFDNQLTTLNVSNSTHLVTLDCGKNMFNSLDLSNNINLIRLNINEGAFSTIDLSNNINLEFLSCYKSNLTTLDVSSNINLTYLSCDDNNIDNLDVSTNTALTTLSCANNNLTSLDVSSNISLTDLYCEENSLTSLNLSTNVNLEDLYVYANNFTTLDLSNNSSLRKYKLGNNPYLVTLNLKNGNNENYLQNSSFSNLPNLSIVGVDVLNSDFAVFIADQVGHPITFTDQANFQPAQSNIINGMATIDMDNNGCDVNDVSLNNVLITADNGTNTYSTIVQSDGSYSLYTEEGNYTISIQNELPSYYVTTPSTQTHTFTGFDNTFTADFCTTPNQTINDVNISLIPTSEARPGFDATYQIVYKNIGTTTLNGSITLAFDDTKLQFLNATETIATQTANSLTFNYTALDVFETKTIDIEFNIFPPPTVNIDEELDFTATINPVSTDNTPDDNIFNLNQIIIGSFDPNDITCLEGDGILIEEVDKYLHYVIRFQNKGTASAINIIVENTLDANLDWDTFQLESASHDNRVEIKNGNEIKFIFEGIELIDEAHDEPNSHGFIAYKIKPLSNLVLGDAISNQADIYFDFNEAVITNIATTTIVEPSSANVNNNTLLNFSIYPVPAENTLHINSKTSISKIEIYNKLGQLLLKNNASNTIDVSSLINGVYFIKLTSVNGKFGIRKVIKK